MERSVAMLEDDPCTLTSVSRRKTASHAEAADDSSESASYREVMGYGEAVVGGGGGDTESLVPRSVEDVARQVEFQVYGTRWYILAMFSLVGLLQGMVWNTFGPISDAVLTLYCPEWNNATLALYGNWGNIMYVIPVLPVMWYFQSRGLRSAMVLTGGLMTVATLVRCLPFKIAAFTWMCHICAILNGISGIVVFAASSALSVTWFPPNERTTATALAIVFNNVGNAVAFVLGPAIVPDPSHNSSGGVLHHALLTRGSLHPGFFVAAAAASSPAIDNSTCKNITAAERHLVENRVSILMYSEFAVVAICFLTILAYFPSKPKHPPSLTSFIERMDFVPAIRKLCSLFNGLVASWYSVMVITFNKLPLGDDKDKTVGYIGMWSVFGNSVTAIIASRIIDSIKGKMKSTLLVIMFLSAICWIWLGLICLKIIPFSLLQLYISTILASSLTFSAGPIFFEFTSELAYPVPEGVVGGFLTCFYNVVGMIFLFLFYIPSLAISPDWIIYSIMFSTIVPIPLLLLVQEEYNRSVIDQFQEPRSTVSDHASYPEID